jgi:hypothetical protein
MYRIQALKPTVDSMYTRRERISFRRDEDHSRAIGLASRQSVESRPLRVDPLDLSIYEKRQIIRGHRVASLPLRRASRLGQLADAYPYRVMVVAVRPTETDKCDYMRFSELSIVGSMSRGASQVQV